MQKKIPTSADYRYGNSKQINHPTIMPNKSGNLKPSATLGRYFAFTPALAKELRSLALSAAEWRLWSYLATLDPFGDTYHQLPELRLVLAECSISKATFYRCLAKFEEAGLIDTQPILIAFKNLRGKNSLTHETESLTDETTSLTHETESLMGETIALPNNICTPYPETISAVFPSCTNNNFSTFLQNKTPDSANPSVSSSLNREGIGTSSAALPASPSELLERGLEQDLQKLSASVNAAGIQLNKTIRTALAELLLHAGSAAAAKTVENAASAVSEQVSRGNVRNKEGLFMAGLRRNFTANQAKRAARKAQAVQSGSPPDLAATAIAIGQALICRDRTYALSRLRHLWSDGWQQQVTDLISLHHEWGFILTSEGVADRAT